MDTETDVLICGSGSAGLCAAVWLARLGIKFTILEKKDGPLKVGQADGVQCRTVEVFESFNLEGELTKDAYWVNEVCFWSIEHDKTTGDEVPGRISRSNRTADVMPGISWQHHVIMNQAHLNKLLLEDVKRHCGEEVVYDVAVTGVKVETSDDVSTSSYPVTVTTEKNGEEVVYKAKYVLGCDGAHSAVRRSLGYKMVGDTSNAVWGVMDIFPQTDFPDIRKKVSIRSKAGNLLIIPREGGHMVRFYLELPYGTDTKTVTLQDLQSQASNILSQYKLDIKHTFWWSAYSIGQRLADHFSKDNRVFLAGDACHTHSPKAGQGMNLSLQDGYNIGWKLAAVLNRHASTDLLKTYNIEREKTASDLIEFDRELTKMFSSKETKQNEDAAKKFSEHFIKSARYTAGLTTTYDDSMITNAKGSTQDLAKNVTVGMRFPSAQVVRFSDARAMQIAKALQATGQWRLIVFAGDILQGTSLKRLNALAAGLISSKTLAPLLSLTKRKPSRTLEPLLVLDGKRVAIDDAVVDGTLKIPELFTLPDGEWELTFCHKIFVDDESYNYGHGHAYDSLGIDPQHGAVVIVRPDHYVSMVTSMEDVEGITDFFQPFVTDRK
ncbi:hypothetical protein BLS_001379 [Venturia inaequalis]|uniref:Phenol 2-monooxygenase n=1 Tax=Venturia inaequalis TaxID=5025 RepID=A0A8H3UVQ0_VENIN|nr:hypothetical protein BLS_001379 [Venturia inaequalis]RDI85329.1 hypothetical protein Vi05172_g4677 [Venturia inaequalis]